MPKPQFYFGILCCTWKSIYVNISMLLPENILWWSWIFLYQSFGFFFTKKTRISFFPSMEMCFLSSQQFLTLSLLGYLKTRICCPSKSHVWCPNMTNDTSLASSCALLLESAKNCKFAKIEFFSSKSSYIVKMFAKKNLSKKLKIIHFWKALDHAISNMQKILQNFK